MRQRGRAPAGGGVSFQVDQACSGRGRTPLIGKTRRSINLSSNCGSATSELDQSMPQIGFVTAALDEIYRDLTTKLPVLDADRLKASDHARRFLGRSMHPDQKFRASLPVRQQ